MPWSKTDYPASMKNLPAQVRNKAIEIGNALLKDTDMEEGIAIATAISRAKDWAANRGLETESKNMKSRSTDVKQHGEDRYVIPVEDGWAIKEEGEKEVEKIFKSKQAAVKLASREAKRAKASVTVQRRTGKVEKRVSYTPHKKKKVKS